MPSRRPESLENRAIFSSTKAQVLHQKISDAQQPDKLLVAVDYYLDLEANHNTQRRTIVATLMMAAPVLTGFTTNAVNLSTSCATGTDAQDARPCGVAAASVVGAAVGMGGIGMAAYNLRKQATHRERKIIQLDEELFQKLDLPPQLDRTTLAHLISEFSELSEADQKQMRTTLTIDSSEVTVPR